MEGDRALFRLTPPSRDRRRNGTRTSTPFTAPVGGDQRSTRSRIPSPLRAPSLGNDWTGRLETIRRSPSVEIISREDFERAGAQWREDADAISQRILRAVRRRNDHERYETGEYLRSIPSRRTPPHPSRANPCRRCGLRRHWVLDCPDYRCPTCGVRQPGHLAGECREHFINRHRGTPSTTDVGDRTDEVIYNEENPEAT